MASEECPVGVSLNELLQWSEESFTHWEALLLANPSLLDLPCDIYNSSDVRGLLLHIVAVELRYVERIRAEPVTPYDELVAAHPAGASIAGIFDIHRRASSRLRESLAGGGWDEVLEFPTLTAGNLRASRRKIAIHAVLHGIRHFAQLATLVRQHGVKPGWHMDFLASSAMV
ncbi:MAG TPA: DinB family protein [Acidisarcina sp.]